MYFVMREDLHIKNRIQFKDIKTRTYIGFKAEETGNIKELSVLFVEGNQDSVYPDFIEAPFFIVSDRLKLLIEPYDLTVQYRKIILNHNSQSKQSVYWLILPEQRDCLHEKTERYPNDFVKKMVLDREKLRQNRIIQVKAMPIPRLVVQLDVSEAILRRDMVVEFEMVDVADK